MDTCNCGAIITPIYGEDSQSNTPVAFFCRRCQSRYNAAGDPIEPVTEERTCTPRPVSDCTHDGAVDTVLSITGLELTAFCRRCRKTITKRPCTACGDDVQWLAGTRGLPFCDDSCRRARSKQMAVERRLKAAEDKKGKRIGK